MSVCPATRAARPLLLWLLRGVAGVALLALAASTRELIIIIPAVLAALVAFGGCPMCWLLGLIGRAHDSIIPGKDAP